MSKFQESDVQEWAKYHHKSPIREERPYRQCPNCGKYEFRAMKVRQGLWPIIPASIEYWEQCKNCKYKGDSWEEDV